MLIGLACVLLLPSLLLAALVARAIAQNRDAWRQLGAGRRPRGEVLRSALLLWSPLALPLLVAVVAVVEATAFSVMSTVRLSPGRTARWSATSER
mgnify:CR=1 FL=1